MSVFPIQPPPWQCLRCQHTFQQLQILPKHLPMMICPKCMSAHCVRVGWVDKDEHKDHT